MPIRRPCPNCGQLLERGERCPRCPRNNGNARPSRAGHATRYDTQWRKLSVRIRKQWVDTNGWVCPGWHTPPHTDRDLVVDHDVGVLCRRCNARKASTFDRERARQARAAGGGGDTACG